MRAASGASRRSCATAEANRSSALTCLSLGEVSTQRPQTHSGSRDTYSVAVLHEQLLAARPGDPFLRIEVSGRGIESVVVKNSSVAFTKLNQRRGVRWVTVVGDDDASMLDVLHQCLAQAEHPPVSGITVPHGLLEATGLATRDAENWNWWWTDQPTGRQPRHAVIPVDHHDQRLIDLLTHSPSAEHEPGGTPPLRWLGVESDGLLVAAAAETGLRAPAAHIAGVVTHADHRGRGMAADICAVIVDEALAAGRPAVCLGMYHGNQPASAVYRRLGFILDKEFTSAWLAGAPNPT
jgi:GNAT superfamily N-acetyltransferase